MSYFNVFAHSIVQKNAMDWQQALGKESGVGNRKEEGEVWAVWGDAVTRREKDGSVGSVGSVGRIGGQRDEKRS